MDKRLMKLLQTAVFKDESCMLDTYNQSVQYDCSCTIRTNINTANHHFIMEKLIEPYNTDIDGNCFCLKANYYKMGGANFIGHTKDGFKATCVMEVIERDTPKMGSNISNTITSVQKDALVAEPLCIPQATKQSYIEVPQGAVFDMSYPESTTRRGRVQEGGQVSPTLMAGGEAPCYYEGTAKTLCLNSKVDGKQPSLEHRIYDADGVSTAMTTGFHPNIKDPSYRIRKLTPRECFRLMGVSETNIDKIQQSGVSQSQQYKMAGNSIVVDVLEHIFRKLFVNTGQESQQLSLF